MSDSLQRRSTLKGDTVTRTYKIFRFEPHLRRKALLIRGEVTVQLADSLCRQIIVEQTKEFRKVIRLDSINDLVDVSTIMDDILEKCPYIEDDLFGHLLNAIDIIRRRKYNENGLAYESGSGRNSSAEEQSTPTFPDYFEDENHLSGIDFDTDLREITMESLEYYVELLYEQIQEKVKGARCIAKLSTCTENLIEIYGHESALNALFRTLREDYKKSMDLTTNILTISLSFATYRSFHPAFITNKICSLLLDIIQYELTRFDKWVDEIHLRKELAGNTQSSTTKIKLEYDKMKIKFSDLTKRQDVLLCSGFNVIRLLAETPVFMKEIIKRGIVKLLMACLERKSTELIITVVSFLQVLSAFKEANLQMKALEIIDIVHILVDESAPKALLAPLIGLLFNLSFDTKLRQKMLKCDLLGKTAAFLNDEDLQRLCIPLLYNFSVDEKIRPKFAGTGTIGCILQLITKSSQGSFSLEAKALTLNLASSKRCCQIICGNGGLPVLLTLAFKYEDNLIMKIIRKLAQHEEPLKSMFIDLVCDIAGAILQAHSQEFAVECMGTLGNLAIPDLDFKKLLQKYNLVSWIKSLLRITPSTMRKVPGEERSLKETALIEVIIFIGTCAGDPDCACYLIQEEVLELLFDLCAMSDIDADITIQILYVFSKFCFHEKSRRHIVQNTDILQLVIELLRHNFIGIRETSEAILNLVGEYDEAWKQRIKLDKFKAYNKAWIDEINRPSGENTTIVIPAYQKQELELFHPQPELHEDELLEHPDSSRSKESTSSTQSETLSDTETEDETEEEEDENMEAEKQQRILSTTIGIQKQQGIPALRSKSIFDRFEHQFMQERGGEVQEGYEYGISEDEDGPEDSFLIMNSGLDDFNALGTSLFTSKEREILYRKNKSATNQVECDGGL